MNRLSRWALAFALAGLVLLVSACGDMIHNTYVQSVTPQQQATQKASKGAVISAAQNLQVGLPCPPPPGEGVPGACTAKPVQVYGTKVVPVDPPADASIPDVSSYQGNVDWAAVKAWQLAHHYVPAGIFKMGEYVEDPYAARNAAVLTQLHMWHAGYWFVRNTGCAHEGEQIVATARALGLRVVLLDIEVPEARGYDTCLTPILRHAHLFVGEYTSPGTYPGGSSSTNVAWMAAYGPMVAPSAPWHGRVVAFQCSDGVFGCVTDVPGIGRIDMSVNMGLTKIRDTVAVPKPKPKPQPKPKPAPLPKRTVCFGKGAQKNHSCAVVHTRYRWLIVRRDFWQHEFNRCIRYADGIRCGHAEHWYDKRRAQAIALHKKYSR